MTVNFYLLENPNPSGPHFYASRRKSLRVIVLHVTASLEDQDMRGGDVSAEQTARYAATTTRQVSWHAGADSDSWLYLLPASYTAWHAGGYNSLSWGLEISKRDTSWRDEPDDWVEATLRNAAAACRPIAQKYGIPARLLSKSEVDSGASGFVYHSSLDPGRRTDPGSDFPIDRFFKLLKESGMPTANDIADKVWSTTFKKLYRPEDYRISVKNAINWILYRTKQIFGQGQRIEAKLDRLIVAMREHDASLGERIDSALADATVRVDVHVPADNTNDEEDEV